MLKRLVILISCHLFLTPDIIASVTNDGQTITFTGRTMNSKNGMLLEESTAMRGTLIDLMPKINDADVYKVREHQHSEEIIREDCVERALSLISQTPGTTIWKNSIFDIKDYIIFVSSTIKFISCILNVNPQQTKIQICSSMGDTTISLIAMEQVVYINGIIDFIDMNNTAF